MLGKETEVEIAGGQLGGMGDTSKYKNLDDSAYKKSGICTFNIEKSEDTNGLKEEEITVDGKPTDKKKSGIYTFNVQKPENINGVKEAEVATGVKTTHRKKSGIYTSNVEKPEATNGVKEAEIAIRVKSTHRKKSGIYTSNVKKSETTNGIKEAEIAAGAKATDKRKSGTYTFKIEKPEDTGKAKKAEVNARVKPNHRKKSGIYISNVEKPETANTVKEAEIAVGAKATDRRKSGLYTSNVEKPGNTDRANAEEIAVGVCGKPTDVVFKCVLEAEYTTAESDSNYNGTTKYAEDKEGALRKSPKSRGQIAKECTKLFDTLSPEDEKHTGCFCRISPKRILHLFKSRSPKCKASSNRSAAFNPIGDGTHFEVVYLGHYLPSEHERVERIDYTNMAEEKIIPTFLGSRPCYDVMPTSGKVVVFSVELLVKNAFSALVSNEIKAAPLWDAGIMDFVGMLTISDFINVLRYYYITRPEDMKDIENQSIATWRRMTGVPKKFVKINGLDSLSLAAKLLIQERIHRIPVFDEKRQCVLFVLTKKRLLQFLSQGLLEKFDKTNVRTPNFFKKTIRELKIGTFEDIAVVSKEMKIIDALDIFITRNVSALPVLNKDNILIDLFEKFDVFGLAKDQTYHNLEMTIDDVISKPYARETAWICTMDETLQTVINKFVTRKVHRLVVIDARRGVAGMISLSDVLKFLVVQPLGLMESATVADTILEASEGAVGGTEVEAESPVEVDLATGVAHMKVTDDAQAEETPADD